MKREDKEELFGGKISHRFAVPLHMEEVPARKRPNFDL
jgi:hypothetical protein